MADVEEQVVEEIVEDEVPEPTPVPFQSLMIAYAALSGDYWLYTLGFMFLRIVMALIPIWFGSIRALEARKKRIKDKEEGKDLGRIYFVVLEFNRF